MRKPHNRIELHLEPTIPAAQPMLKRSLKFRYDLPKDAEVAWGDSFDFDTDPLEFDMDVTGAGAIGGPGPIRPTQLDAVRQTEAAAAGGIEAPQDEVNISSAARALGELDQASQLHEARLAEIRAAIAEGLYDTPDKLDAAVDRLVQALRDSD